MDSYEVEDKENGKNNAVRPAMWVTWQSDMQANRGISEKQNLALMIYVMWDDTFMGEALLTWLFM